MKMSSLFKEIKTKRGEGGESSKSVIFKQIHMYPIIRGNSLSLTSSVPAWTFWPYYTVVLETAEKNHEVKLDEVLENSYVTVSEVVADLIVAVFILKNKFKLIQKHWINPKWNSVLLQFDQNNLGWAKAMWKKEDCSSHCTFYFIISYFFFSCSFPFGCEEWDWLLNKKKHSYGHL